MPTANERRALWFLAAVALSGSVVRLVRSREPDATPDPALLRQIDRVDSVRSVRPTGTKRKPSTRASSPTPQMQLIDLNSASAADMEELPGIGPALAERIVAARDSQRGFRDVAGLCGVRGVGPALISRLRPQVTLSGERLAESARCPGSPRPKKSLPR